MQAERQAYEQQHMLLTQKIRQTVLTRSGVVREPQLKEEDDSAEVIDLTDKKKPPKTVLTSTIATSTSQSLPETTSMHIAAIEKVNRLNDGLGQAKLSDQEYLQQQRELLYMHHSLQVSEIWNVFHIDSCTNYFVFFLLRSTMQWLEV